MQCVSCNIVGNKLHDKSFQEELRSIQNSKNTELVVWFAYIYVLSLGKVIPFLATPSLLFIIRGKRIYVHVRKLWF